MAVGRAHNLCARSHVFMWLSVKFLTADRNLGYHIRPLAIGCPRVEDVVAGMPQPFRWRS